MKKKKYIFTTSGVNKQGQRTEIFSAEFFAANAKELENKVSNLNEQYFNQEPNLDFVSYSVSEIILVERTTINY